MVTRLAGAEKSRYRDGNQSILRLPIRPNPHTICHCLPICMATRSMASCSPYILRYFATYQNPKSDVVEGKSIWAFRFINHHSSLFLVYSIMVIQQRQIVDIYGLYQLFLYLPLLLNLARFTQFCKSCGLTQSYPRTSGRG